MKFYGFANGYFIFRQLIWIIGWDAKNFNGTGV